MLKRLINATWIFALPLILAGCPGQDDPTLGEQIDEAVEEVGDEIDDAL